MTSEWALVAHIQFLENRKELTKRNKYLDTNIEKKLDLLRQHPEIPKNKVSHLPEDIAGKVYKIKAGGQKGHNIYYLPIREKQCVLIPTITLINRGETNYRKDIPEEEIYIAITDFNNKDKSKVRII